MSFEELRLPADARLVHIGPHKTGTTTVQGAFHAARERLGERGIAYAGESRQPVLAVQAATGQEPVFGDPEPNRQHWHDLLADMELAEGQGHQVVLSSEFFADAEGPALGRIAADLGPRTHVVVTLRPLSRLLPSQWQQNVQSSLRMDYDRWLHHMLREEPYSYPTPSFWRRHDHAALVGRWVDAVGADHVTVIVIDESDPGMLLHCFEGLLGLPEGLLVPESGRANRSLTYGETEMVRHLNIAFKERELPPKVHAQFVRLGGLELLKTERPDPAETPILTPAWAVAEAAEIGAKAAIAIESLGVRVAGDLRALGSPGRPETILDDGAERATPMVTASAAARALLGSIEAMERSVAAATPQPATPGPVAGRSLDQVRTKELGRVLAHRVRRAVQRRVHPARD